MTTAASASPATSAKATLPLSGITVLDLTLARAGPTCVRHLADWGANIIRIEPPPVAGAEDVAGKRDGFDFQNLHRNKRMVNLDLKSPEGHAAFMKLVEKADVIIENMRSAVKYRLKVSYDDVKQINPRIVYGSISGFGQSGPYGKRAGVDQIVQGMGGLMSITGLPGQGPVRVGIPIADLTAGNLLALGVMIALFERVTTGVGRWVTTSLLEAMIFMLDFQAARYLVKGEVAKQAGNNHPTSIPTGVFQTKDGYLNLATTGQAIWERCVKALGADALLERAEYKTMALRSKSRDKLNDELQECFKREDTATWVERLNAAGVPCGPIYGIDQMFADPQVQHLRVAQPVAHSNLTLMGQPIHMSRTPSTLDRAPPDRGAHNDEVLAEFGLAANEIAALRSAGTI